MYFGIEVYTQWWIQGNVRDAPVQILSFSRRIQQKLCQIIVGTPLRLGTPWKIWMHYLYESPKDFEKKNRLTQHILPVRQNSKQNCQWEKGRSKSYHDVLLFLFLQITLVFHLQIQNYRITDFHIFVQGTREKDFSEFLGNFDKNMFKKSLRGKPGSTTALQKI